MHTCAVLLNVPVGSANDNNQTIRAAAPQQPVDNAQDFITAKRAGAVFVTNIVRPLLPGDRVVAASRHGFPSGTVVQYLDQEFVLVRWDGDLLETAHRSQLDLVQENR
jgi:hypothetical protein